MADTTAGPDAGTRSTPQASSGSSHANGSPRIDKLFRACIKQDASDLHLKAGSPPRMRIGGVIRATTGSPLENRDIEAMCFEIMNEQSREQYAAEGSLDFAYQMGGAARFRINMFRQRGQTSVAARRVPMEILDYEALHLPPVLEKVGSIHQGLVLVSGITGSGKSTTIASIIEQINQTRACHIITLEDPIEFLYSDKKAFINQREVGLDVENFHEALKYLMREDPDVVLIGELRDAETFSAALQAAESGHLVFGTVHASGTAQTVTRVLELFPEESRELVRMSLVFNLQSIICLKLLKGLRPDVPRIPAVEIMFVNSSIRKLVANRRENEIINVIRSCRHDGMQDFNESLRMLVEKEYVAAKVAYEAAPNPDELKMRLKGIQVTGGGIIG